MNSTYTLLTPADFGILAAVLDDCLGSGDDDTVEELYWTMEHHDIARGDQADELAYYIVHECKRKLVDVYGALHSTMLNNHGRRVSICIPGRDG